MVAAAKALDTVQDETEVLSALEKVSDQLDRLDDLERQYADLQLHSNEQLEELTAEVARLKAIIKHGDPGDYTIEELLKEIVKKLLNIVRR